ncbi:MAG: hypothetical protein OQK03_03060 [Colwellia sp.]|nr:hypothetical protein [Colwellia sp.]
MGSLSVVAFLLVLVAFEPKTFLQRLITLLMMQAFFKELGMDESYLSKSAVMI